MLCPTYELQRCVETPITLGQNDPCMPTLALFLQYSKQRDFVAFTVAGFVSRQTCSAVSGRRLDLASRHCNGSAAAIDQSTHALQICPTCSAERSPPNSRLVTRLFGQSYRMARRIDAAQA